MPYSSVDELPPAIRKRYSPKGLRAFMAAFNQAMAKDMPESRAFAIAHTAAQGVKMAHPTGFKLSGNKFVAWYTNAYEDRDGEYFAEKAIEQDIERMYSNNRYPELWFFHEPIRLGQVDFAFKAGRFAIAIGTIDNTPQAQAIVHYAMRQRYKLSHGYTYNPRLYRDQTYHDYETFEISLVPSDAAANPLTNFSGGKTMNMAERVKAELAKALAGTGIEPDTLIQEAKTRSEQADAQLGYKALAAFIKATEVEDDEAEETPDVVAEPSMKELMKMVSDMKATMDSYTKRMDAMEKAMGEDKARMEKALAEKVRSVQSDDFDRIFADLFSESQTAQKTLGDTLGMMMVDPLGGQ